MKRLLLITRLFWFIIMTICIGCVSTKVIPSESEAISTNLAIGDKIKIRSISGENYEGTYLELSDGYLIGEYDLGQFAVSVLEIDKITSHKTYIAGTIMLSITGALLIFISVVAFTWPS